MLMKVSITHTGMSRIMSHLALMTAIDELCMRKRDDSGPGVIKLFSC